MNMDGDNYEENGVGEVEANNLTSTKGGSFINLGRPSDMDEERVISKEIVEILR
jgi:hypothetical protein